MNPDAPPAAAIPAQQVGANAGFIQEHLARGIERRRRAAPRRAGCGHVSAMLFGRACRYS